MQLSENAGNSQIFSETWYNLLPFSQKSPKIWTYACTIAGPIGKA
ncbi:MAG: hypothetical protein ACI8Z0_002573, partial [Lentimonas sp.]